MGCGLYRAHTPSANAPLFDSGGALLLVPVLLSFVFTIRLTHEWIRLGDAENVSLLIGRKAISDALRQRVVAID